MFVKLFFFFFFGELVRASEFLYILNLHTLSNPLSGFLSLLGWCIPDDRVGELNANMSNGMWCAG
jgi:ABC-type multidrug transport system permease subunit